MARRCGNCIHKNVCDLYDIVQDPTHAIGCGNFLDVADVVPKSEVERLENAYSRAIRKSDKKAIASIQKAKQDVASEIFSEIEKHVLENCCVTEDDVDSIWKHIAELKKKYMEGEDG